jgi:hypothetical protein
MGYLETPKHRFQGKLRLFSLWYQVVFASIRSLQKKEQSKKLRVPYGEHRKNFKALRPFLFFPASVLYLSRSVRPASEA